jgi:riboflavin synthase
MFTGIIEELGEVLSMTAGRAVIGSKLVASGSPVGASVSVNGVCLTVVGNVPTALTFDLSDETLMRTSLGRLGPGSRVNLERPVTLATRLGGHMVQGHVDGVGELVASDREGDGAWMRFQIAVPLMRYVVEKGSIAIDGISLTVAKVHEGGVTVAVIPHTLEATTLGSVMRGDPVNLEVDVIAKYVERMLIDQSR